VKIKNLLSKSPRMLREDPVLSIDYLKIINLIQKKKLLERTSDAFDPDSTFENDYFDLEQAEMKQKLRQLAELERLAKNQQEELNTARQGATESYDA
jgi:predicted RNA-binding protein with PUA-like domain